METHERDIPRKTWDMEAQETDIANLTTTQETGIARKTSDVEAQEKDIAKLTATQEKHLANLGPLGVVRETFRLCWEHPGVFFIVGFLLVSMHIVGEIWPSNIHPGQHVRFSYANPGGAANNLLLAVLEYPAAMNSSVFVNQARRSLWMSTPFYGTVFMWITGPPWMAAVLYAVGLIYTGSKVSINNVLGSLPNLPWKRVVATRLVYILLIVGIFLVTFAGTFWLAGMDALQWIFLPMVPIYGCVLVLDIIFGIAEAVSVLEEDYGWAAFKKSVKLLSRGRIWVAVGVVVLLTILSAVPQYFLSISMQTVMLSGDVQLSNVILTLFALAPRLFWMSLIAQLTWLAGGVMYVSFKAYHNKRIFADSSLNQGS